MTGLYDHVSGRRKVEALLSLGIDGAFLELDIDQFKAINDTCGHQAGDLVILSVADALCSTFRSSDIIIRMGGDEFGVFAAGITEHAEAEAITGRLFRRIESLRIPELGGMDVRISVGVAFCKGDEARSFNELYDRADSAMYAGKKSSGNTLTFSAQETP